MRDFAGLAMTIVKPDFFEDKIRWRQGESSDLWVELGLSTVAFDAESVAFVADRQKRRKVNLFCEGIEG